MASGPVFGGEVLGIICERQATMSGDPTASTLHSTLLLHASQPYCRMLITWISTGYLSDPFEEFMVRERSHINKRVLESDYTDEYWERRYTVSVPARRHVVADFLRSCGMARHLDLRTPQRTPPSPLGSRLLGLVHLVYRAERVYHRSCSLGNTKSCSLASM